MHCANMARCSHSGHHRGCILVALDIASIENQVSVGHSEAAEKEEVRGTEQHEVELGERMYQVLILRGNPEMQSPLC